MADKLVVSGARGASLAELARRTGNYGALPTDNDYAVLTKLGEALLEDNPAFQSTVPGPAGPTFTTLSAFRAAPVSNRKQALIDPAYPSADYYFETVNAPYVERLPDVIKADSTALSVGAWVRQGADGIAYAGRTVDKALDEQSAKLGQTVYVTDPPYNAVGDGITDDSAAIQAAVDANKGGTIILPAGKRFLAAGTTLSGPSYNGTRIVVEGTYLFKSPVLFEANFQGVMWGGIILHDVEECQVDVPGMMDGNYVNQLQSEQTHLLVIAGSRKIVVPRFNCRELMGDGIFISVKTLLSPSTNSSDIYIGPVHAINAGDYGRNAVSLLSGENIVFAGGVSIKVGGTINGLRMPGGFDIEPDDASRHLVKHVRSGPWVIETAGTSGIAVIGHAITNDAARDWCIEDVQIAPSTVTVTSNPIGGPIFKRNRSMSADVYLIRTGAREDGIAIDYQDDGVFNCRSRGCKNAVVVGFENRVVGTHVNVVVEDHSAAGLLVVGAARSLFTGRVRGGQGAGSYGVHAAVAERGTLIQSAVTYAVDVPYDSGNTYGFLASAGMSFDQGSSIANCSYLGYPDFNTMVRFESPIRSRNVAGRNNAGAVPTTGYWAASDVVMNDGTAAAGTPGWVNTTAGGSGTFVFKAMANVAA